MQLYCFVYIFKCSLSLNFNHILSEQFKSSIFIMWILKAVFMTEISEFFVIFIINSTFSIFSLLVCHKVSKKVHILDNNRRNYKEVILWWVLGVGHLLRDRRAEILSGRVLSHEYPLWCHQTLVFICKTGSGLIKSFLDAWRTILSGLIFPN